MSRTRQPEAGDALGFHWTPPSWLRHVTPWSLLRWLARHLDTCWTEMVMWKQFGGERCWWPTSICFMECDYCGKYEVKELPKLCGGDCGK